MDILLFELLQTDQDGRWIFHFFLMVLVSMIPFAPIPLLASYVATNYDFLAGLFINLIGTTVGSIILFVLSKTVLRKLAQNYLTKQRYLTKYIAFIQKNGFLAVLLGRIVPILPSAGINLIAGISNVRFGSFFLATLIGKSPTILAFSLAGNQIAHANWDTVLVIALYLIALFLIARIIKRKWIG